LLQALKYPFDDLNEKAIYTGIGRKKRGIGRKGKFFLKFD
jgi:hypothetical protein